MHKRANVMFKDKIATYPKARKLYTRKSIDAENALSILVEARKWAGITQRQIAEKTNLCTKTISLIEKNDLFNSKYSPSLGSLMRYAAAFEFKLEIKFVPIK